MPLGIELIVARGGNLLRLPSPAHHKRPTSRRRKLLAASLPPRRVEATWVATRPNVTIVCVRAESPNRPTGKKVNSGGPTIEIHPRRNSNAPAQNCAQR